MEGRGKKGERGGERGREGVEDKRRKRRGRKVGRQKEGGGSKKKEGKPQFAV